MRKVKMRTTAAGPLGVHPANSVQMVSEEVAKAYVDGGYAEYVDKRVETKTEEKKEEKAPVIIETASTEPEEKAIEPPPIRRRRKRK